MGAPVGLTRAIESVVPRAVIDWRSGATHLATEEVERSAQHFVGVGRRPPDGLTEEEARYLLPVVGDALDAARPHAIATRRSSDLIPMLERGGGIDTAFTRRQGNPLGPRGALYLAERFLRERMLGVHGVGTRSGHTVYAEVVFQRPGAALPGPRPEYGDIATVFPGSAVIGSTLTHRDSFAVRSPSAIAGIEHLADVVLRSEMGKQAIKDARRGATIDLQRFRTALDVQLGRRDHGIEQYIEVQVRP
ncbi:MAG: hypothetical protein JWN41_157, partial [Thermoleophilia bacterium]|nr:hypothetical protein [Thermoleophilia bacterium]